VEGLYEKMKQVPYRYDLGKYENELNDYFLENGIGWQLRKGKIKIRGTEALEEIIHQAKITLDKTGRSTAKGELREAIIDLSRRPEPDITGAIQHSMASLEYVARDVCGDNKTNLGDIVFVRQMLQDLIISKTFKMGAVRDIIK
jgi:hypothetical protein